eukprot:513835-Prymnesium_polylepis.1
MALSREDFYAACPDLLRPVSMLSYDRPREAVDGDRLKLGNGSNDEIIAAIDRMNTCVTKRKGGESGRDYYVAFQRA